MLKDKKILLGVTGGIAAYKAIDLASRLKKEGAIVRTILTNSALKFISENNFRAITGQRSYIDQFELEDPISHISLADWADIFIIAPATANILGKLAHGIGDDLLSTTAIAFHKKIILVPAMNVNMYHNAIVQDNVSYLRSKGVTVMDPAKGMLACGYEGKGKYPPNEDVLDLIKFELVKDFSFPTCNILISAGASVEDIDPMRFISNHSTGRMGINLAKIACFSGNTTTLVHSKISVPLPYYFENCINENTAQAMFQAIKEIYQKQDVIIMTAAVADYTPITKSSEKIKKKDDLVLELERTTDILNYLGQNKVQGQILVGFAAESNNVIEYGKAKLIKKNLDLLIANNINVSGSDDTKAFLITRDAVEEFQGSKFELSIKIFEKIEQLRNNE